MNANPPHLMNSRYSWTPACVLLAVVCAVALAAGCDEEADQPLTHADVLAAAGIKEGSSPATPRRRSAAATRPSAPPGAATQPDDEDADNSEAALFRRLDESFGRAGEVRDGVYRLVTPRSDLLVTIHGMDVPTGAFLESDFRFWRCPCGKLLVNGQFVLTDYEANDVVDELQKGGLHVAGIGPVLLYENPRLLMVRFQGEGKARELTEPLKAALSYTAEARNAPQATEAAPPAE